MTPIRLIAWIVTGIFALLFVVNLISIDSNRIPIPFIFGSLIGHSVVPGVFWLITYFVEKKK